MDFRMLIGHFLGVGALKRFSTEKSVADIPTVRVRPKARMSRERNYQLLEQASSNLKGMVLVNLVASICAAIAIYPYSAKTALYWLCAVGFITILRASTWGRLLHRLHVHPPAPHEKRAFTRRWSAIYLLGLVSAAAAWIGLLSVAVTISEEIKFLVMIIIAALAGGATGVAAPMKWEGRLYISALLLPSAVVLALNTHSGMLLAFMDVIFWAVMIGGHTNNHRVLLRSLELQLTNTALINDLTELNTSLECKVMERTKDLQEAALTDALTGLPNRRGFQQKLTELLEKSKREDSGLAIGAIDLDGFKPVNDAFGHATGDQLLMEVGERLRNTLGEEHFVARLGGDEFGFIIDGREEIDYLQQIGDMVCRDLAASYSLTGVVAEIGASVGMCTYPWDADTAAELSHRADYALYHAKQARKGTAVIFNHQHEAEIRELANMEQVFRRANLDEELYVVFQPIIHAEDRRTYSFEALARWQSPILGNVPPDMFIRAAERSGFIVEVTRYLITKALKAALSWPKHLRIAINLSARDIASMDAVEGIINVVQSSPIDPGRIVFEITETALVCDFDQAREALNALHHAGVQIALDDFGTGHSSLSHLRLLPFDKLKVDSSFVADINKHQASEDIVRTLIGLCDSMRIDCVIEGVETREHMEKVIDLGANLLQGYYLARPMQQDDIQGYLQTEQTASVQRAFVDNESSSQRKTG